MARMTLCWCAWVQSGEATFWPSSLLTAKVIAALGRTTSTSDAVGPAASSLLGADSGVSVDTSCCAADATRT